MIKKLISASAILSVVALGAGSVQADPGGGHADAVEVPLAPAQPLRARPRWARAVAVRVEEHAGFSRLSFPFGHPPRFSATRTGDTVALIFQTPVMIAANVALPHGIGSVTGGLGRAEVTLAPGQEVRAALAGNTVVLDVFAVDPAATTVAAAAPAPMAAAGPAPAPGPAAASPAAAASSMSPPPGKLELPPARTAATDAAPKPAAPPSTAPVEPVQAAPLGQPGETPSESAEAAPPAAAPGAGAGPAGQTASGSIPPTPTQSALGDIAAAPATQSDGPVALSISRVAQPAGSPGAAIFIPYESGVGLAAARRGDIAFVVFDLRRPFDVAPLHDDPVFANAAVQLFAGATLLRFGLPADSELRAARVANGWRLWVGPPPTPLAPVSMAVTDDRLMLGASGPGKVIVMPDPTTGNNLLIGTQTSTGQGVAINRHTAEFSLLATWQGVVVEPLSDRVELRTVDGGFVVSAGGGATGLALSAAGPSATASADAAALTRRFDFVAQPKSMLLHALQGAIAAAAAQPRLARLRPRADAARLMISLGLNAEAQALLQLAAEDDPHGATDPDIGGLGAIAALLAGRPAEAGAIADPALGTSDEMNLWRGVRTALTQEGSPAAAAQFAATTPLILAYPDAMQSRLLPLAAETMVLGAQTGPAAALLAKRPDDPALALARAMLKQAQGDTKGALAAYDVLAGGSDQLVGTRAGLRAIELRLASGAIKPADAADAEEHMLYAWRGDERERALRLRIAALRATAGQWRKSLTLLRESDGLFGPQDPRFAAALRDGFGKLIQNNTADQLPPMELVELVEENADLMPEGAAGEAMVTRLADRLDVLDLPRRADPVLERLVHEAGGAGARGEFGARLAQLRLAGNDAAGALTALSISAGQGLSPSLIARRTLLTARALAKSGKASDGLKLLAGINGPAADETRATIAEQIPDWPAAERAMMSYVAATVSAGDVLTPANTQAILRLAGEAAQAGDEAGLAALRGSYGPRITDKAAGDLFRALTADPVRGLSDLPRSGREVAADRGLPQALQVVGAAK